MIDTQAIRNKILDLAIRGKLTEQLSEDGTAEKLYQQIQAEKQTFTKTGRSKQRKLQPEITDNELPFDIPSNWKWVHLGELISIESGRGLIAAEMKSGRIPVYGGNGITGYHDCGFVPEGTVIIGRVGYYCGSVHVTEQEAWVTDNAFITTYPEKRIDKWFLVYVLRHMKLGQSNNGSAQPVVSGKKIYPLAFPLPPLAEQHRIVDRIEQAFSALDTIDALQAKYADNLTVLKSKLIDAAIQGKLTEQLPKDGTAEELYQQIQAEKHALIKTGKIKKEKPLPEISAEEIPFEIPSNWKWVRLGNIGITATGGTPSKTHPEYYGGNYPFFKPSDLDAGRHITKASEYLTEAGKVVSRQIQQNSILVCCIGSIGKAAIIDTDGTANQQINALTPLGPDSDYLLYAISSSTFQHQLDQGSRATTVSIINKSKFDNCILPLPPLSEQERIVERLNKLLALCCE